jgi:quercetin dioxygenase-like cupin family protein
MSSDGMPFGGTIVEKEEWMSHFHDLASRETKEIAPGIRIRTFWGDRMLVSVADLDANVKLPLHSHPHEQAGVVLSGELQLTIGEEMRNLKAGDSFLVPGGVEHGGRTGDGPVRVMDIFSPVRQDYQY